MSSTASLQLFTVLGAALGLAACTADIAGKQGGAGPVAGGAGSMGVGGSGTGPGMPPDGALPSPVCQAGSVIPSFHRLNRVEYQNSVNALLGTDLPLAQDLPVDSLVYGFDNNADVSMSATLLQKYLNVAQTAVEAALASPTSKAALVPCALSDTSCARSVLEKFLGSAYRRLASAAEVDDALGYMAVCSSSPEAGLSCALQATLLSSKFLFRTELLGTEQAKACSEAAPLTSSPDGALSAHALAARLSYWLTSSAPDAELYAAAASGALATPEGIAAAVERLLASSDAGSHRAPFLQNFPSQWLQLSAAAVAAPSPTLFPDFDEPLRQALGDESRLFFAAAVTEGRSALELVRSDYSFLNERLASHYGIAGVTGPEMQLVSTAGTLRGGILTQASFTGPTANVQKENKPKDLFDRLTKCGGFGGSLPMGPDPAAVERAAFEKKVMGSVKDEASRLMSSVGQQDRLRLQQYCDSVAELERRFQEPGGSTPSVGCESPSAPAQNGASFLANSKLMMDTALVALKCGLAPVATLMLDGAFSHRNYGLGDIDGVDYVHGLSHGEIGGKEVDHPRWVKITSHFFEHFAYLLQQMDAVNEGEGTMLDNSIVFIGSEFGNGDGHSIKQLPLIIAGSGGGRFNVGRQIAVADNTPSANAVLDVMRAAGVEKAAHGNSTGSIPGLAV